MLKFTILALALLPAALHAQLFAAKDAPFASGHIHINTANLAEQLRFWHLLGAQKADFFSVDTVQVPNLIIMFTKRAPTGGTRGSAVNHVGFEVRDIHATVAKVKEAGFEIITRTEAAGGRATSDIFHSTDQNIDLAFLLGPEGFKVEIIGNPKLETPIAAHHYHLAAPDPAAARDWYVKTFGLTSNKRGPFEEAVAAGIRVSFMPQPEVAPTAGRVLDHIGFEVNGIKQVTQELTNKDVPFTRPYMPVPRIKTAIAFLLDPNKVNIELTEGLRQIGGIGPPPPLE